MAFIPRFRLQKALCGALCGALCHCKFRESVTHHITSHFNLRSPLCLLRIAAHFGLLSPVCVLRRQLKRMYANRRSAVKKKLKKSTKKNTKNKTSDQVYVCESQSQSNYWPKDAIQMTAYHEWMRLAAAADYNVIWIPLSDTVCFVVWQTVLHPINFPSFVHGS
jgi:hypothetical protein